MDYRRIDIVRDKDTLLEFHCRINYASETPYARRMPYERYRARWLSTSQPEGFLSHLAETMQDERTLAEFLEEHDVVVGYLWLTFHDLLDYDLIIAEVMDLAVAPAYQRRGIGLELLRRAEEVARRQGATLLRSDTGSENVASQRLHEKLEFRLYKLHYEKVLRYGEPALNIPLENFVRAAEEATDLLGRHRYDCDISADDFRRHSE